jgi:uncharacterized protein
MATVFIIHGTRAHPESNWFAWLRRELEALGHTVIVPKFPTPENQHLETWSETLFKHEQFIHERTIFVAHSVGPAFVLSALEQLDKRIKAAFFVSGFTDLLGIPEFDNLNRTFVDKQFDWDKIKANCARFVVIHSDNDPYVPLDHGRKLAKNLGVALITIKNGGHLNADAGFTKFPVLLELIKKEL